MVFCLVLCFFISFDGLFCLFEFLKWGVPNVLKKMGKDRGLYKVLGELTKCKLIVINKEGVSKVN